MRKALFVLVVAALALISSAAAGGPPPVPPAGTLLGPPVSLPAPKPGHAVFAAVTVTGTPRPGVTPSVTPIGYGRPPANLRVVSAQAAPISAHGKRTITFYFAIGDVSKPAPRRPAAVLGGAQVDFLGTPTQWLSPTEFSLHNTDCAGMTAILEKLKVLRVIYSLPGDRAIEMWRGAWDRALCRGRFTLS